MNLPVLRGLVIAFILCLPLGAWANSDIEKIATWNMKWLGTNSGNKLDPIENVDAYARIIIETDATLFALQEVGATHSVGGEPRCYYLDLIVQALTETQGEQWTYVLDAANRNQRLAYLYREDKWALKNVRSVWPGKSYRSARRPFVASVSSIGNTLDFDIVNVHFKAFPGEKARKKRSANIRELAGWLSEEQVDIEVVIAGDTNIYPADGDSIQQPLIAAGFSPIVDNERTAIHKDKLSNRFDRFYASAGMSDEILTAAQAVGDAALVDVVKENSNEYLEWFDQQISDHFPVVLNVAVR